MLAVLLQSPHDPESALYNVAGKSMLYRQLQWLLAAGCDQIVVEVPAGLMSRIRDELAREATIPGLSFVESQSPLTAEEAVSRAFLDTRTPRLVLDGSVIGEGDLADLFFQDNPGNTRAEGGCILGAERPAPSVRLERSSNQGVCHRVPCRGWLACLTSDKDAFTLTMLILREAVPYTRDTFYPIQIEAIELLPQVWVCPGARVHPTATLLGPVLIEDDVEIGRGSIVGPEVVVGRGGVLDPGAHVRYVHVRDLPCKARTVSETVEVLTSVGKAPERLSRYMVLPMIATLTSLLGLSAFLF
jgi:hypothetical protein